MATARSAAARWFVDRRPVRMAKCRRSSSSRRLGDALRIADQDRLDQALFGRQQRAAQRIVILRADDDGLQAAAIARRARPDARNDPSGRRSAPAIRAHRRSRRDASARRPPRCPCRPTSPSALIDRGVEHRHRLCALLAAGHGDAADGRRHGRGAGIRGSARDRACPGRAEDCRARRKSASRPTSTARPAPGRADCRAFLEPAASADWCCPRHGRTGTGPAPEQTRSIVAESPTFNCAQVLLEMVLPGFMGRLALEKSARGHPAARIAGVRVPKPRRHGPPGDDRLKGHGVRSRQRTTKLSVVAVQYKTNKMTFK